MVMYIVYKDVKVLKEQVKLPDEMAAAAKLGEIAVDLPAKNIEEIAVKPEVEVKGVNKGSFEMV